MTDLETLEAIRDLCHTIMKEEWVTDSKATWSDARYYEEYAKYQERKIMARTILALMEEKVHD